MIVITRLVWCHKEMGMYVCLFEAIRMSVFLVDRSIIDGKLIEIDQTMMRESANVRTGVTDASVPNTVVHDFLRE